MCRQETTSELAATRYKAVAIVLLLRLLLCCSTTVGVTDEDCQRCHSEGGKKEVETPLGVKRPVHIDYKALKDSAHGGVGCLPCHNDIKELPHWNEGAEKPKKVDCGKCHEEERKIFKTSVHYQRYLAGDADVPSCRNCHGDHYAKKVEDALSSVSGSNLIATCEKCHTNEKLVGRHPAMPEVMMISAYENSVHNRVPEAASERAAICSDCHGKHTIQAANSLSSPINRKNVPKTCGKCHSEILKTYQESVHGTAVAEGNKDAPVCTDCHGEHTIAVHDAPDSRVAGRNIPRTCGACHENQGIIDRYGLPSDRVETYEDSYHGIANEYGNKLAANCASCHGYHDILPASNPKSSVNTANIPATCGKCHPKASKNFAQGKVHVKPTKRSNIVMYFVRKFYIWFTTLLGVAFVLHIINDFRKKKGKK